MPDFRIQPNFPISTVIDASQRKAQLEQQANEKNTELLNQSLTAIGTIGKSLQDQKKQVAQALALGRQFDIPDDVAKSMEPSQILQVGAIKKGQIDMNMLLNLLHPGAGGTTAQVPTATPASATTPTPASPAGGPMLTSNVTATPIPEPTQAPLMPPTTGSMPVPIAAPPIKPAMVNPATFNAAFKMASANRLEPVVTQEDALAQGGVKHGTHIINPKGSADPKEQDKLEQQYRNVLLKPLSNRSGGLGLEDAKVNQAIHLRTLINKFYDTKTQTYNIPPSMHAELALGLARLQSPTGQVGIELVKELRQRTAREGLAGALIFLGADPHTVGGPTQSVSRLFVDSIDRQGQVSEANREQYMDYLRGLAPTDLDPTRKEKLEKGKLNSFQSLADRSPDRQSAEAEALGTAFKDTEKEKRYQEWKRKQSL